jgi:hypothetical protein
MTGIRHWLRNGTPRRAPANPRLTPPRRAPINARVATHRQKRSPAQRAQDLALCTLRRRLKNDCAKHLELNKRQAQGKKQIKKGTNVSCVVAGSKSRAGRLNGAVNSVLRRRVQGKMTDVFLVKIKGKVIRAVLLCELTAI